MTDYIKSGDTTISVSDASQFAPGDNVAIYSLSGELRKILNVSEVRRQRKTVTKVSRWRMWLAILRHPFLWLRFRRDPVGYYIWLMRRVIAKNRRLR